MFVCGACGQRYERAGYCAGDGQPLDETSDALLGTEIGRYRIARLIGEGGMGQVYLGVQPAIGSRVAIKILSQECSRSPELLERFFAEARSVNLIKHENIVSVLDLAQFPDGRPFIVMEFIEGQTLGQIVRDGAARGEPSPIGGVVQLLSEVLSALGAAHALGIVHRDLKPDNILVTGEGHAKVLDFGIAKLAPGLSNQMSPRTRTGALLGTPAYMAPEQISGGGLVDARTDLYAAGVVVFEAVTGATPFQGETLFDLMRAHLEQRPPSPRALRVDLPIAMEQAILRALEKDPAQRFQSASEMSQALHDAARDVPADQWRSLSGRMITGRSSMEHARQLTPQSNTPHDTRRDAHAPTVVATPVPSPIDTKTRPSAPAAMRRSRTGVAVAIAAVVTVAVGIALIVVASGNGAQPADSVSVVDVEGPAGSAAEVPVPTPPRTTPPPVTDPPTTKRSDPPVTKPVDAKPRVADPPPVDAGPKIIGGGSAADHGVHIGSGVTIGPGVVIGSDAAKPQQGVPGRKTRPITYDPKKFDATAFAPKALAMAREIFADAGFVRADIHGVFPNGLADLTLTDDDSSFLFRSPANSARPANVPKNLEVEINCYIEVTAGAKQIEIRVRDMSPIDTSCKWPLRALPRCSLAKVWGLALKAGADKDTFAKIGFLSDGEWFFDNDTDGYEGMTESFPDRCP